MNFDDDAPYIFIRLLSYVVFFQTKTNKRNYTQLQRRQQQQQHHQQQGNLFYSHNAKTYAMERDMFLSRIDILCSKVKIGFKTIAIRATCRRKRSLSAAACNQQRPHRVSSFRST